MFLGDRCSFSSGPSALLHNIWKDASSALFGSVDHTQRLADRHRIPTPDYQPGQKVWLCTKDIPLKTDSKELSPRYIGPRDIVSIINPLMVRLKLPGSQRIMPTLGIF